MLRVARKPRRLYGEAGLLRALGELIGDDGGVLSRSPLAQIEAIELLVRLSACYRATRRDPPDAIPANAITPTNESTMTILSS